MQISVDHIESLLAILVLQKNDFGYKQIYKKIFPFLLTSKLNELSSFCMTYGT
jgi:hypothetical protein